VHPLHIFGPCTSFLHAAGLPASSVPQVSELFGFPKLVWFGLRAVNVLTRATPSTLFPGLSPGPICPSDPPLPNLLNLRFAQCASIHCIHSDSLSVFPLLVPWLPFPLFLTSFPPIPAGPFRLSRDTLPYLVTSHSSLCWFLASRPFLACKQIHPCPLTVFEPRLSTHIVDLYSRPTLPLNSSVFIFFLRYRLFCFRHLRDINWDHPRSCLHVRFLRISCFQATPLSTIHPCLAFRTPMVPLPLPALLPFPRDFGICCFALCQ